MTSKVEQTVRDLMAHFAPFLAVQYNVRPDWLINPETGKRLEIDLYFPQINVGIEVNGAQHYRPTKWSTTPSEYQEYAAQKGFEAQLRRDTHKRDLCEAHGIQLDTLAASDLTEARFRRFIANFLAHGYHTTDTGLACANPVLRQQFEKARYKLNQTMESGRSLFARAQGYNGRITRVQRFASLPTVLRESALDALQAVFFFLPIKKKGKYAS